MKDPRSVNLNRSYHYFAKGLFTGAVTTIAFGAWGLILDRKYKKNRNHEATESLPTEHASEVPEGALEDVVKLDRGREILKYGMPEAGRMVHYYGNHTLMYNQQTKTPIWVAEHLNKKTLQGTASRKYAKFKPDPSIDTIYSADNRDYWKSGWSRGHMAPAGNSKTSPEAMQDSFYLSNIVPQNYENNAGFWNRLEMYCRDLTKKYSNVYIISGPVMVPEQQEDGKKFIKYQVIGDNEVAVPTHLYKVIVVEDKKGKPAAIGSFVVPNEPIGFEHHLKEYEVEIQDLERCIGVRLLSKLDAKSLKSLCKVDGCKLMAREEFELYFIGRKLDSANTLHRVEKVWAELEEKKLKPDKYLKELYKKKIRDLKNLEKSESS